jgi:hypothetical protein
MSTIANLTFPVLRLIGLIPEAQVSGPDERGHVWLRAGGAHGEAVDLGHIGTAAAEAALRWRAETGELGSPIGAAGARPPTPH